MTSFVDIQPGQWVLAFQQPYYDQSEGMSEWLERFTSQGGGWDTHRPSEIFVVHQIESVKPKTYFLVGGRRCPRSHVIATGPSRTKLLALRDRFFSIGESADDQISFVVERLARPIRRRVYAKALKEIHKTLPHIFGGGK